MQLMVLEFGRVVLALTLKGEGNLQCCGATTQKSSASGFLWLQSFTLSILQASRVLKHQNTFLFPLDELHETDKQ